jgi:parallel beta-helix repeat protein
VDSSGPLQAGSWYELDVTSLVAGNGLVSLALTTSHTTALSLGSRESANAPQLIVDTSVPTPTPTPPPGGRVTTISRVGDIYFAQSQWGGNNYSGTNLSTVGMDAIYDMNRAGGGTISFQEGIFNLGTGRFDLDFIADIVFEGQGIDNTVLMNNTNASMDTEPFDFHVVDRVTIRDLTVSAGGSFRSTSDAIDLDAGNNVLIERVKITSSRSRGIVFDGKGTGWTADNNIVRDCIITGVAGDGIELLASKQNRIEGCTISDVGGYGIQITKASTVADQPNKKSSDNLISGNIIENAAQDGINIISSDRNDVTLNSISGSGRDGVRIDSSSSVTCDQNSVTTNTISNSVKWGLNIDDPLCHGTVVNTNSFSGNGSGSIRDLGTGTIY